MMYRSQNRREKHIRYLLQTSPGQDANEKQVEKPKASSPQTTSNPARRKSVSKKGEKIKKDLDEIMDEIDDVLEENAEEFIRSYVQRGGE